MISPVFYKKGYSKQTTRECWVDTGIKGHSGCTEFLCLTEDGLLTIAKYYAWDGASGPTLDTKSTIRASLVHDSLYQLVRLGILPDDGVVRAQADKLLQQIMDLDSKQAKGVKGWLAERWNDFRGFYWWRGVRRFGGSSADPKSERPELVAP